MKIVQVDDTIKLVDFENFLDVYEDSKINGNPYTFNLNSTVYFDDVQLMVFNAKHDMFWTTASYMIYGTTRLWWLLMKLNNVNVDATFEPIHTGQRIFYISKEEITYLINQIGG